MPILPPHKKHVLGGGMLRLNHHFRWSHLLGWNFVNKICTITNDVFHAEIKIETLSCHCMLQVATPVRCVQLLRAFKILSVRSATHLLNSNKKSGEDTGINTLLTADHTRDNWYLILKFQLWHRMAEYIVLLKVSLKSTNIKGCQWVNRAFKLGAQTKSYNGVGLWPMVGQRIIASNCWTVITYNDQSVVQWWCDVFFIECSYDTSCNIRHTRGGSRGFFCFFFLSKGDLP
jgi:hypothetical protein